MAINAVLTWQDGLAAGTFLFALIGVLAAGVLIQSHCALRASQDDLREAHRQAEEARARAEAALKLSSVRLAAIIESSSDAIIGQGLDGTITSWNPGAERMYGYTADEVTGKPVSMLAPAERPEESIWLLDRIGRGERVEHYETVRVRKDGRPVDVSISMAPIRDGAGETFGVATIERDVSERKRSEAAIRVLNDDLRRRADELTAANKELEAFSYSVSHDLRAPLRAMNGFSRILAEEYGPQFPPEARRYIGMVRDNAQQMGQLVDDLLRFSRLSRQPLTLQTVAPADLVRQTVEELQGDLEGRQVELRVGDLPDCQADPALLKQVFANLLGNALKFTRHREVAVIEVDCRDEAGETVYYIRDNGVGFDPRFGHKLFGVFQRLHRAEDYDGTGVGLAIVQRIVHRHGGRIWAEGELDRGATFSFTLGGEHTS